MAIFFHGRLNVISLIHMILFHWPDLRVECCESLFFCIPDPCYPLQPPKVSISLSLSNQSSFNETPRTDNRSYIDSPFTYVADARAAMYHID